MREWVEWPNTLGLHPRNHRWFESNLAYQFYGSSPAGRNTEKRVYSFNGKIKTYIPDFIVDGNLVEIKGFKSEQWEAKIKDNPDVIVLYESEIKPYIDYAISKHGKDFIKIYMGS